ncbi:MAG: hypothetical protein ACHRXM_36200 [Isosphaerales bacterium]
MKAGDTFYIRDRSVDAHLWVVISDPEKDAERVVIVSMTTYENYKEDACLLDVGDHPRISHKTCIAYNEARMTALEKLIALRDGGQLSMQALLSPEVLARIRNGVSKSTKINYKYIEFLLDQGVIE